DPKTRHGMGAGRPRTTIWCRMVHLRADVADAADGRRKPRQRGRPKSLSRHAERTYSAASRPHAVAPRLRCFWSVRKGYRLRHQETPNEGPVRPVACLIEPTISQRQSETG